MSDDKIFEERWFRQAFYEKKPKSLMSDDEVLEELGLSQ